MTRLSSRSFAAFLLLFSYGYRGAELDRPAAAKIFGAYLAKSPHAYAVLPLDKAPVDIGDGPPQFSQSWQALVTLGFLDLQTSKNSSGKYEISFTLTSKADAAIRDSNWNVKRSPAGRQLYVPVAMATVEAVTGITNLSEETRRADVRVAIVLTTVGKQISDGVKDLKSGDVYRVDLAKPFPGVQKGFDVSSKFNARVSFRLYDDGWRVEGTELVDGPVIVR
jgi:hypothetical protein